MRPSGFIIRFIDIGLLLLIGFLMISDLSVDTQIRLPGGESSDAQPDQQETMVSLEIQADNSFRVRSDDGLFQEVLAVDVAELEQVMKEIELVIRQSGQNPVVLIKPSGESAMQTTVHVMDLCDELGLPKNLSMEEMGG